MKMTMRTRCFCVVLFVAALGVLFISRTATAQLNPILVASPKAGNAGDLITLRGGNYDPGNYEGLVFWNGKAVDALKIPAGGDFSVTFRIPPAADPGVHIIRVCAAERPSGNGALECFSGDFEQIAEAPFEVQETLPIRVCKETVEPCSALSTATVYNTTTGQSFGVDENGYLVGRGRLRADDRIWSYAPDSKTANYTLNITSAEPVAISDLHFDPQLLELRLAPRPDAPLLIHNLTVAAEWYVEGDPLYAQALRNKFERASQYLYDITEGQMALGEVTVYQSLDNWDDVDVHLYGSNTLRPNAIIGGVVSTYTADLNPVIDIVYEPGTLDMGSQWNRFGVPPGQQVQFDGATVATETLTEDWSMAFAHEMGHYSLFLFDTYRDAEGEDNVEIAAQCFGSAMSDVYKDENHALIGNPDIWKLRCGATEAYAKQNARTEWDTILGRYPNLIKPPGEPQANQLPVNLTNVLFIAPAQTPGAALPATVFDLNYQDAESSSGEARAFLYRNDRIFEQGKPIKDVNKVTLTGPEASDLLCVYDVNDYSQEDADTPRNQFGCETIQPGDTALEMTKNSGWRPVVTLHQISTDTLRMTVTQELPSAFVSALTAKIYPEHKQGLLPENIPPIPGSDFGRDIVLQGPVPPLYVQLYVDETVAGLTTRRETVLDRGTGGGGLFGPAKQFGGVLVYSSDGEASFSKDGGIELGPGESIAWQTMPGTPPMPANKQITGQAYRLDAYPASNVADGAISIEFREIATVSATSSSQGQAPLPAIHFYDGRSWLPVATTIATPANGSDGKNVASASSQGVGVYAVLYETDVKRIMLPYIARP